MSLNIKYIVIILLALVSLSSYSQAPTDSYDELELLENQDTLRITRSNGTWWYGVQGGADYYQAFGTLYPYPPTSALNVELERGIEFGAASGLGTNYGLMFEWMEPGSFFGALLRIDYDMWSLSGQSTEQFNLDESEAAQNFNHFSDFSYLRFSPSARYNPWENGFHLIGGFNIDVPMYEQGLLETEQRNTGLINDGLTFYYNSENASNQDVIGQYTLLETNYGIHFGLGWDYLLGDVFGTGRLKATPFAVASFNYGMIQGNLSDPFDNLESSLHFANLRVGIQIKFAQDNITYDTLKFDPTYREPVLVLQDISDPNQVDFSGFIRQNTVETSDISFIELPQVQEQLREEAVLNIERPKEEETDLAEVPQKPAFDLKMNIDKVFNYPGTRTISPTIEMRDYLDAIADYMRDNPNVNLNLVAHTDNSGSRAEQDQRGRNRLDRVKEYLIRKGISERRLIDRNRSGSRPITSNRTEAGRRQNRRLILRLLPGTADR